MIRLFFLLVFSSPVLISSEGDYYLNKGLENKDNLDYANQQFILAYETYKAKGNIEGMANASYFIGYSNELKSNFHDAILSYYKTLALTKNLEVFEKRFMTNERLMNCFIYLNLFSDAFKHLQLNEEFIYNSDEELKKNRYFYDYAFYYFSINKYKESLSYLKLIDINLLNSEKQNILNLFAVNHMHLEQFKLSLDYYLEILESTPNDKLVLANLIVMLSDNNMSDSADYFYSYYEKSDVALDKHNENISEVQISEYLINSGKYELAFSKLDNVQTYFETNEIYSRLIECLDLRKRIYYNTGQFNKVDSLTEIIFDLKDKMFHKELETSTSIIRDLGKLENEMIVLKNEADLYKSSISYLALILVILIVLVYLIYKNRQIKLIYENDNVDTTLKLHRLYNLIVFDLNRSLNSFAKVMNLNLDFDENNIIFKEFDEIVKVNIELDDVVNDRELKPLIDIDSPKN